MVIQWRVDGYFEAIVPLLAPDQAVVPPLAAKLKEVRLKSAMTGANKRSTYLTRVL